MLIRETPPRHELALLGDDSMWHKKSFQTDPTSGWRSRAILMKRHDAETWALLRLSDGNGTRKLTTIIPPTADVNADSAARDGCGAGP
jgi:hypothetical protein